MIHEVIAGLRRAPRLLLGDPPLTVGLSAAVLLALVMGSTGGAVEALLVLTKQTIMRYPSLSYRTDVVWVAPLVNGTVLGIVAMGAAGCLAIMGRRIWLRPMIFTLAAGLAYSWVKTLDIGIERWAAAILAVGIGVQTTRVLGRRLRDSELKLARVVLGGSGALAVVASLTLGVPALRERVAIANLGEARPGPNILLLILDTVRAQSLSLYGYERATTPMLERIGDDGVVFENAIAPSSWTLASHASMFTGVAPNRLTADWFVRLDGTEPTLAEVLASEGYATAAFAANYLYAGRPSGLARGFTRYQDEFHWYSRVVRNSFIAQTLNHWFRRVTANEQLVGRATAANINDAFLDWLGDGRGRPFFAFLNYFDAHDPYLPPQPFNLAFADTQPTSYFAERVPEYPEELLAELRAAYDGSIAYADEQVGLLVEALRSRALLDNTILIITSDHGEQFGETNSGLVLHGNSLFVPSLHVPLVIRYPTRVPVGGRVESVVSLQNLGRTALDIAGVDDTSFPGRTLMPAVSPASPEAWCSDTAFSELRPARPMTWVPVYAGTMHSVLVDSLHYIRLGDGAEELYNVRRDPWERSNLADDVAVGAVVQDLRAVLHKWLDSRSDLSSSCVPGPVVQHLDQ
jgi:arylsulfatase A-like enzyme